MTRSDPAATECFFAVAVFLAWGDRWRLFVRDQRGTIHSHGRLEIDDAAKVIDRLAGPLLVVLAGDGAHHEALNDSLLHRNDLFVVPEQWLQHIPKRRLRDRARVAARVAHADLVDPIDFRMRAECPHHCDLDPDDLWQIPF